MKMLKLPYHIEACTQFDNLVALVAQHLGCQRFVPCERLLFSRWISFQPCFWISHIPQTNLLTRLELLLSYLAVHLFYSPLTTSSYPPGQSPRFPTFFIPDNHSKCPSAATLSICGHPATPALASSTRSSPYIQLQKRFVLAYILRIYLCR